MQCRIRNTEKLKIYISAQLIILILLILGCNSKPVAELNITFNGQSFLDKIDHYLNLNRNIQANDARLLFSNSKSDKYHVLFLNSNFFDTSSIVKENFLKTSNGQKLLAKLDSIRIKLKSKKQNFEFPIKFNGPYNVEHKSFYYCIDSQAFTTIDLEYQILNKDTSYYLSEKQAQSILEEGLEYQKSKARMFKDMYLPIEFVQDIDYSHKHPRIEREDMEGIQKLDYSKILVSRLYKIPIEESKISLSDEGRIKMGMSYYYTGNIIEDHVEIKKLEIRIFVHSNDIIFSKRYY